MPGRQSSDRIPGGLDLSSIPFFCRADGAFVHDDAGTPYLDLISGYGTVIAGHANPELVEAVARTIRGGTYMYGHHAMISLLEERLIALFPGTTRAQFFKTGSEAVQCAVRLARAFTGRQRILQCGFHGWHDQFMTQNIRWHDFGDAPLRKGAVAGVPSVLRHVVTPMQIGDPSVAAELRKGDVAALIFDPVQLSSPSADTLEKIRSSCRASGALLIVDESKTGFRLSASGFQGLVNVYGDLTILSKALANGFPLAAVLASDDVHAGSGAAKIMGTYNHELSAVSAAHATLDILLATQAWAQLSESGNWLVAHANDELKRSGCRRFAIAGFRWPCMPILTWAGPRDDARNLIARAAQQLLEHRILWLPHHMNFLSLAHTRDHIEAFVRGLVRVCTEVERDADA